MVNLTRIYTKTGDDGTTALGDFTRTSKNDPRLAAYADVDEANSAIGVAIALGALTPDLVTLLTRIQNDLFDVGADLCNPITPNPATAPTSSGPLRIAETDIERLESACDHHNDALEKLRSFILPAGTPGAALLHVARTVARRAERSAWSAVDAHPASTSVLPAKYLNRLSDLLFILARVANIAPDGTGGDVLWVPGANR